MALTKQEEIALHQVLEIPLFAEGAYVIPENGDGFQAIGVDYRSAATQAKAQLDDHLARNVIGTGYEDELKRLLARWIGLGTSVATVEAGQVGSLAGVSYSPDSERAEIRRQILVIVPFFRRQDELIRAAMNRRFIPVVR